MHTDLGGVETEVSKQGHSLCNPLHICMNPVCAPTRVSMQVHTVHSLLHTNTDISRERNCVSESGHTLNSCLCMRIDFVHVQICVTKIVLTSETLQRMHTYHSNEFTGVS